MMSSCSHRYRRPVGWAKARSSRRAHADGGWWARFALPTLQLPAVSTLVLTGSALVLIGHPRDAGMGGAQRRRPALAQVGEIGFAGLDAIGQLRRADIPPRHHHVD